MPRFYLTSHGDIVDSITERVLARLKARAGWRDRGEIMCTALNMCPKDEQVMLDLWAEHLEDATAEPKHTEQ